MCLETMLIRLSARTGAMVCSGRSVLHDKCIANFASIGQSPNQVMHNEGMLQNHVQPWGSDIRRGFVCLGDGEILPGFLETRRLLVYAGWAPSS